MDLHDEIMNIQVDEEKLAKATSKEFQNHYNLTVQAILHAMYRRGHRDACHAAAELAAGESSAKRERYEIIAKHESLLQSYAASLGLTFPLTLEELIASHARVTERVRVYDSERNRIYDEARERGYKEGMAQVVEDGFVSLERLRKMTVAEVCVLVGGNEPKE